LNNNFNTIGFFIIGIFLCAWLFSILIYRVMRYDEVKIKDC